MTLRRLTCAFGLFGALVVASCASSTTSDGAPPTSSAATVPAAATGAASTTAAAATTTPGATTAAPVTTALPQTTVALSTTTTVAELPHRPGSKHMHFEVGPIDITPGQNNIDTVQDKIPQPEVDGWIVSMQPNLRLADGSIPPVDVVHLHHGVWLNAKKLDATAPLPERFFAV